MFDWKKTLHIVRGLPGEGKSTLALQLVGGKKFPHQPIKHPQVVENDDYWMLPYDDVEYADPQSGPSPCISYKYQYESKMTHLAGWYCFAEAFRRLRIYDVVAVANTFVQRKHIFGYIEEARKLQVRVKLHRPTTPWIGDVEESFKRNVHAVPMGSIQQMQFLWEELTQAEVDILLGNPPVTGV